MSKALQVYYTAVFGALGGLAGWWTMGSLDTTAWSMWLEAALVGSGLGLWISALIAASDGAVVKRSAARAIRDGILGGLAGALAGLVGLLIAQGVWELLEGGFIARGLTWMLLGALIGLGDLLVRRRPRRAVYAALGGMAGGLLGGLFYEGLTQLFLERSNQVQVFSGGLGLVLVGACIGALIPLARQFFAGGELRVVSGAQTGLVREVTDTATIGRYDGNDLYLPDSGVAWRHAVVRRNGSGFELEILPEAAAASVGAAAVTPDTVRPLRHGDRIHVGDAVIEFVGR